MGSRFHTVEGANWIYLGRRWSPRQPSILLRQHHNSQWRPPHIVSTVDRRPTLRHAMPSHGVPSIASTTGPRNQTEKIPKPA
ncbi:hypothetical protein HPP92_008126 [Vanilla planifolia]|uniref:Uncharacterized protein n=1 Tax=Vanilla planifolia TaxID=51239 RepID=A0A835RBC4_VANPL|nr:hypothetical protein HPP92_008126 [Vanilla planifolia]